MIFFQLFMNCSLLEDHTLCVGEIMFSKVYNASKVAFIHLIQSNTYKLTDCQVYNVRELERSF